MLSGYIFPLSSLPGPLRLLSRGAARDAFRGHLARHHHPRRRFHDLVHEVVSLALISVVLLTASVVIFRRKRL